MANNKNSESSNSFFSAFIKRNTKDHENDFSFSFCESSHGLNSFSVECINGKVFIKGDCVNSLAQGFYYYLKKACNINYSWCGNTTLTLPEILPTMERTEKTIRQKHRAYFNYCTFGYSAPFWDFERWEKELDFMAMNGINLFPAAIGSEAIWYYTLVDFGFTKDEALSFVSGPAFFPWQIMTNIEGVCPVKSEEYILSRLELGKKILERMNELNIIPIQTGFSGFVPRAFKEKFPNAKILKKKDWCSFNGTCEIDPLDPLFKKFGLALLNKQAELFGKYHFCAADPFHESAPPVKGKKYLKDVSKTIQGLFEEYDKDYVWVMQSWSINKTIACQVKKEKLLVLDLNGKAYKTKRRFWGYPYVRGTLHNFGGRINLHGDAPLLAKNKFIHGFTGKNICGTGLFMEGINQNPYYYDLAFSMLTADKSVNLRKYTKNYCLRRYGNTSPLMTELLLNFFKSVYKKGTDGVEKSSIVCARPALNPKKSGPNDGFSLHYDNSVIKETVSAMISEGEKHTLKDGFYFDLMDFTRQYASNRLREVYEDTIKAYTKGNLEEYKRQKELFLLILTKLDALLLTRKEFNLYTWLNQAENVACPKEMKDIFIVNGKSLITVWGEPESEPSIFDYAWREWGGLIGKFYIPRWKMFFDFLDEEIEKPVGKRYSLKDENKLKRVYGREAFRAGGVYNKMADFEESWRKSAQYGSAPESTPEDTLRLAEEIIEL